MLKERWQTLLTSVPDITIGAKDDIDSLISVHLDRLSEDDAPSPSPSPSASGSGSNRLSFSQSTNQLVGGGSVQENHSSNSLTSFLSSDETKSDNFLTIPYPVRSASRMEKYYSSRNSPVQVELKCFHQCFPDGSAVLTNLREEEFNDW